MIPRNHRFRLLNVPAVLVVMLACGFGTFGTPSDVFGQAKPKEKEELKPPIPPTDKEAKANYWGMLAVLVGVGVLCAVNLIPSKRGHQD